MSTLRYLNGILTVLALLLGLHVWVLLAGSPAVAGFLPDGNTAHAVGVGGTAERQVEIRDELRALNKEVSAMSAKLDAGLEVSVTSMPSGD